MPEFNLQFPAFRAEDLDDGKQQRRIIAYLKTMYDELKYLMMNLDEENLGAALSRTIESKATSKEMSETNAALEETRRTLIWEGKSAESVGAGSVWGSLNAIAQAINGRRLDEAVTVNLTGSVTGATTIDGLTGRGRLTINAQTAGMPAYALTGDLTLTNCMTPIEIDNLTIIGKVSVSNCRFVRLNGVTIMPATPQSCCLYLDQGAACDLFECRLFNGTSLIEAHSGVILTAHELKGYGTNFINGEHMIAMMDGTRPDGGKTLAACLASPANLSDLTPDDGSI